MPKFSRSLLVLVLLLFLSRLSNSDSANNYETGSQASSDVPRNEAKDPNVYSNSSNNIGHMQAVLNDSAGWSDAVHTHVKFKSLSSPLTIMEGDAKASKLSFLQQVLQSSTLARKKYILPGNHKIESKHEEDIYQYHLQEAHQHSDQQLPGTENQTCISIVPRFGLNLTKMLGVWYPAKVSQTTKKLWTQSFKRDHPSSTVDEKTCFLVEYSFNPQDLDNISSLDVTLRKGNEASTINALLIGDERHPKESVWAISWPNDEDTLTSVVAAGVIGKNKSRYNWLLTVDCDLSGIVEQDWAVMARIPEGISNATLSAILMIVEGLKGLTLDAITYQPNDCHN